MKDFVEGRIVYIVPTGNLVRTYGPDTRKGVITKVGRKYIYIKIYGAYRGGEEGVRFDKETLRGESEYNSTWLAFGSEQEIKDRKEVHKLHNELQKFFSWGGKSHKLTLKQLRAIKEIIESPEKLEEMLE